MTGITVEHLDVWEEAASRSDLISFAPHTALELYRGYRAFLNLNPPGFQLSFSEDCDGDTQANMFHPLTGFYVALNKQDVRIEQVSNTEGLLVRRWNAADCTSVDNVVGDPWWVPFDEIDSIHVW